MRKLLLVFVLGLFGQCAFSRPDDIPVIIHRDWNNRVELVSSCVKDTVRVWVGVTLRFNAEFFEQTRQVKLSSVTFSSLALNVKDSSGKVRYLKYDRYDMPPDSVRCIWDVCAREVVRLMWYQSYDDLSGNEYDEYDELKRVPFDRTYYFPLYLIPASMTQKISWNR